MPTYDFQCESCGKLFEARVNFSDAAQSKFPACPGCQAATSRRILSATVNILTNKPATAAAETPTSRGGGGCCGGSCGCG